MKQLFATTILTFFLIHFSFSQNYVVSGAGKNEVNGVYVQDGTYNGKPIYKFNRYMLVWECYDECDNWHILDQNFNNSYYVTNANESNTPPSTDWKTSYDGTNPVPSVEFEQLRLSYSESFFLENMTNDGNFAGRIQIKHNNFEGNTFKGSNAEDFILSGKATIVNLPTGLIAVLNKVDATTLELSLTGHVAAHTNSADINNLTLEFNNNAFSNNVAADVNGYLKNDIKVNFIDVHTVASSGADFTSISAAVTASENDDIIELAAETFTEYGIDVNKALTFRGQAANTTIIQANASFDAASDRVFNVVSGLSAVKFYHLTIQNGKKVSADDANVGGAVEAQSPLEFYNCIITKNIASGYKRALGGAIHTNQNLSMVNCLVSDNTAKSVIFEDMYGGALFINGGKTNLTNCTFSGNSFFSSGNTYGGAIYASQIDLKTTNCTFSVNTSTNGGAIAMENGTVATFKNVIAYGNTAANGADIYANNATLNVYNSILGVTTSDAVNGTNINVSNTDPLLNTLADNGGQSFTFALAIGSSAIDAGYIDDNILFTDQRGKITNGTRDIGAFEFGGLDSLEQKLVPIAKKASNITTTDFTANWDAPVSGTVIDYLLYVSSNSSFSDPVVGSPFTVSETSKTITGLKTGTDYFYNVRVNESGTNYTQTIKVTTKKSKVSALGNLSISSGVLSPTFTTDTLNYHTSVSIAVADVFVTPIVIDSLSKVEVSINNGIFSAVGDQMASANMHLLVGNNTIKVKVIAQNDSVVTMYTVSVFRIGNSLNKVGLTNNTYARVAFALRKLSDTYTGPLLRVNIDNTYYDIYPDAEGSFGLSSKISASMGTYDAAVSDATVNELSTVSSDAIAKVAVWYDQSGNNNNLMQSNAAKQPRIINNGLIDMENNKPFMRFFGQESSQNYQSLDLAEEMTINAQVIAVNKFVTGGKGFILGSKGTYYYHASPEDNLLIDGNNSSDEVHNGQIYQNGQLSTSLKPAVWNTTLMVNSLAPIVSNIKTSWDNIGRDRTYHHTTDGGGYAELITFSNGVTNAERKAVENSQIIYYNIPAVAITSFTPQNAFVGDTIKIKGKGFTGATALSIQAINVNAFTVTSDTTMYTIIESLANPDVISVTTPEGNCTSIDTLYISVITAMNTPSANQQFVIFPNPVSGDQISLAYNGIEESVVLVKVLDINGKIQSTEQLDLNGSGSIHLNKLNLSAGLYYLTIQTKSGLNIQKLIVE